MERRNVSHSKPMPERNSKNDIKIKISDIEYSLHEIVWEDIVGDSSIQTLEEALKIQTATIKTYAYILKKDKKYLYTFASYSQDGCFGDRNIIPLGVVQKITKITA